MKQVKTIMLIEDDVDDQLFFTEALSKIENTVLYDIAGNGKEALEHLRDASVLPDIIFSDIEMPVMSGIECLIELKKNPRTYNIPVVILSSAIVHAQAVRNLGASAFIEKPHHFGALKEELGKIISWDFIVAEHILVPVLPPLCNAA